MSEHPFQGSQEYYHQDQILYPAEFKIVELPIVPIPVIHPIKVYKVKIYRDTEEGWKRKCFGTIKFLRNQQAGDQYIYVAAHEFGTCINRLTEVPTEKQNYNLHISEQFAFNWEFRTEEGTLLSIALQTEEQFFSFKTFWETSRTQNTVYQQENWISFIDPQYFEPLNENEASSPLANGYIFSNPGS